MDFVPAEQIRQVLAHQEMTHELMAAAKVSMEKAQKLITQLREGHGERFICGGVVYTIAHKSQDDKWPYSARRLETDTSTPVIDEAVASDTVPAMPGMRGESIMPARPADRFRKELEEMNDSDKPITFGKEIRVNDTGEVEAVKDECETQPKKMGGDCY